MGTMTHGHKSRHKILIDRLDEVSRRRALTLQESLSLERAIRQEEDARRARRSSL